MKRVAVLGSTGSIGRQALEVIAANPGRLSVRSLLCSRSLDALEAQRREFPGSLACALSAERAPSWCMAGEGALEAALDGCDIVLNAITGFAGLRASLEAARLGLPVALANKESLVTAGCLLRDHVAAGLVIPVDSEHSTIARCLCGAPPREIVLTASGGALRDWPADRIEGAGPEDVGAHPTWDMGPRITVDSSTLVNKAFEVIEARWLFPGAPVSAVLHPQSVVHSLVRLGDGSWRALLGRPDMRIPIQHALLGDDPAPGFAAGDEPCDWPALTFAPLDLSRWPAFGLVTRAGEEGGTMPAAANAADEVAVDAFLRGRLRFGDIARVIGGVLESTARRDVYCYGDVLEGDAAAREAAGRVVSGLC